MSFRRLKVLIDGLPPESATKTAVIDSTPPDQFAEPEGFGPWSRELHMLASIRDSLEIANWQRVQANTADDITPPEPTRRPGLATGEQPVSAADQAAAVAHSKKYLDKIRAGHGALNRDGG